MRKLIAISAAAAALTALAPVVTSDIAAAKSSEKYSKRDRAQQGHSE
jgi:hypothetical protein